MKEHLVFKKCKNYLIAFFAIHKLSLKNKLYIQTFSVNFLVLENLLICCSLNTANLSWKNFKTRRSILGSDCMTLILMLCMLSECSMTALWLLWLLSDPERWRLTALDNFVPHRQTDTHCDTLSSCRRQKIFLVCLMSY